MAKIRIKSEKLILLEKKLDIIVLFYALLPQTITRTSKELK